MSIEHLNRWDCILISDVASDSMRMFIGHYPDIERIADRFCDGHIFQAWSDIIEKGILELTQLCDMDDKVNAEGHI